MGVVSWWKRMKETYGDDPHSFKRGMIDGKALTVQVKAKKMMEKEQKKRDRIRKRRFKEKKSIFFRN